MNHPNSSRDMVGTRAFRSSAPIGAPDTSPRKLWFAFTTVTEYGGGEPDERTDEYAVLVWEAGCNEHM